MDFEPEDVAAGPEVTSGLTSALQIVDVTAFPVISTQTGTAVSLEAHMRFPSMAVAARDVGALVVRPISRPDRFERSLRGSLSDNIDALRELSRL